MGSAMRYRRIEILIMKGMTEVAIAALDSFRVGNLNIEVYPEAKLAGQAAAERAATTLRELAGGNAGDIGVIFATGASQIRTLEALTGLQGLSWNRVIGFHMDEYEGMAPDHPASFRRYMRERLTSRVSMKEFHEIDATGNLEALCRSYADLLDAANPQLCLLGIGENGHLAFNDPPVADFHDPLRMKVVELDEACKQQQFAEGWFDRLEDVAGRAVSLTIPTLMRVPRLIASVPGPRKAHIVSRSLTEPITPACPATLLRTHPDCTVYLDRESASELHKLSR
jgi:glucosamine-6-phosphate deaminase